MTTATETNTSTIQIPEMFSVLITAIRGGDQTAKAGLIDLAIESGDEILEIVARGIAANDFPDAPLVARKRLAVLLGDLNRPYFSIYHGNTMMAAIKGSVYCKTIEEVYAKVAAICGNETRKKQKKADEKKKLEDLKKDWQNTYQVGQLLYNSWGYDQTNIDFAQIVAVGRRTVTVARIEGKMVEAIAYAMAKVAPVRDRFLPTDRYPQKTITVRFSEHNGELNTSIGWSLCSENDTFLETSYA